MLFGKKKNPHEGKVFAPAKGMVVPISEAPDKVFSEKVLGDGVAVIIEDSIIRSPVDGVISTVADTLHAYGIETEDGLELLVHIGINTVELNGMGFDCKVKDGQRVKMGDVLCEVDLELIKEKGYPLHTPVLITNAEDFKVIRVIPGNAEGGETVVIEYEK
jgi:glucose-specific phosphotransferase system IIA component